MGVERTLEGLGHRLQHILDILREGRRSLAVPEASEWKALSLARWQMRRALGDFVEFKKRHILEPLIARAPRPVAARAATLADENDRLELSYEAFVRHWVLNSPVAADAPYRTAALAMAAEIERRVIGDVQHLETLVRSAPAILLD